MPLGDYLDAKFPLDDRSLNPAVRDLFLAALRGRDFASILDLGCGHGATLRRLLAASPETSFALTAVDRDPALLEKARIRGCQELGRVGFAVSDRDGVIQARRHEQRVTVRLVAADVNDFEPGPQGGRFDLVTAHALMDLVPLAPMARRIQNWLTPGGLFYATLNYDGCSSLFPPYADPALEAKILAVYDTSMERYRGGLPCGGAHSGRRLHAALLEAGYAVLAYGSSDWNLTPVLGRYRDADHDCLTALLGMMRDEAGRAGCIDPATLNAWHVQRLAQVQSSELGLIIHQIDVLGQHPA